MCVDSGIQFDNEQQQPCCCLLLKQVIDSHQFKPTDVFTGNHIYNTNVGLNWCESITCLSKRQQQQVE